jgi:hypothetical protein
MASSSKLLLLQAKTQTFLVKVEDGRARARIEHRLLCLVSLAKLLHRLRPCKVNHPRRRLASLDRLLHLHRPYLDGARRALASFALEVLVELNQGTTIRRQ